MPDGCLRRPDRAGSCAPSSYEPLTSLGLDDADSAGRRLPVRLQFSYGYSLPHAGLRHAAVSTGGSWAASRSGGRRRLPPCRATRRPTTSSGSSACRGVTGAGDRRPAAPQRGEGRARFRFEPFVVTDRLGNVRRIAPVRRDPAERVDHRIWKLSDTGFSTTPSPTKVPEGQLNFAWRQRDASQDSRVL